MERTNNENIPEKFQNMNETFVKHLSGKRTGTFSPFPKNTSFLGKEKEENVILIVRSHWTRYFEYITASILTLILPTILATILAPSNMLLIVTVFLISLLISLSFAMFTFLMWNYNVNIITDRRVIDIDVHSIFSHTSSEARLNRIEDVTSRQEGTLSNIFDIGTVHIQTAGTNTYIEFDKVPKPREIQDILSDLLELSQKGKHNG